MAKPIVPTPTPRATLTRPRSLPVSLGDALPEVLAEMRRIQTEAGR